MSMVGLRPKQFIDQHDYHEMKQGKVQVTQDNDMYIDVIYSRATNKSRCHII